jgi:endonuclease-3 related protein
MSEIHLKRTRYLPPNLGPSDRFPDPGEGFWGRVFSALWDHWGDPHWWPAESAWEVAAGAILTQNTSWKNARRALNNLNANGWTSAGTLLKAPEDRLGEAIRPSRYFNAKVRKLRELAAWWVSRVEPDPDAEGLACMTVNGFSDDELRAELLDLWGVGPETADGIACYAFGRPTMTIDAYTQRIATRLRNHRKTPTYDTLRNEIMRELPNDPMLFNHFHGLLDVLGHHLCTPKNPRCTECPLLPRCKTGQKLAHA